MPLSTMGISYYIDIPFMLFWVKYTNYAFFGQTHYFLVKHTTDCSTEIKLQFWIWIFKFYWIKIFDFSHQPDTSKCSACNCFGAYMLMSLYTWCQVTAKFKCVVRVVAALPWRSEDFCSPLGNYRIRLTLEDPTARIHAFVYADDGVSSCF